MTLSGERFGRDAAGHLAVALSALAAAGGGGPAAGTLVAEAGRRLGFAEAAARVSRLYGLGHAACLSASSGGGERVRRMRVPSPK